VLCSLLWVTLLGQGVGLGDPQRSLPTPAMLGFCDSAARWARGQISEPVLAGSAMVCGVAAGAGSLPMGAPFFQKTGVGIARFAPAQISAAAAASAWIGEGEIWPGGFSSSRLPQLPGLRMRKQL